MNCEFELLVYSEYPYFTIHQTMMGRQFQPLRMIHYIFIIYFISDGKVIIQFVQNHLNIFCFFK